MGQIQGLKMKEILVVDDVEIMREVLKDLLIEEGYTVASCSDGQEALNLLKKE
ncbi:MAG: response regulator [Lentisphaeraceae bacterium]|nr:response regulator [Lentisphaeraceae bacterium]